jgi:GMP synthase-like glutamine amidotransferase
MDHDHLGRFAEYFAEDGVLPTTVRPFKGEAFPALADFDLMFVMGGAQDTWQEEEFPYLREEKQVIAEWVGKRAKPFFGICLGHQLLADAMGGAVGRVAESEVGVFDVNVNDASSLLAGVNPVSKVMQWHHAEVQKLPDGGKNLASSARSAIQALQIGEHAFSTQFHCEFTPQSVMGWGGVPSYVQALEKVHGAGAYGRLIEDCWPHMPGMATNTRKMWENFKRVTKLSA